MGSRRSSGRGRPRQTRQRDDREGLYVYTKADNITCQLCQETLQNDKTHAAFVFRYDVDVGDLLKSTRGERRKHLNTFLKMVNILLNEGGGVIYIHTETHLVAFWDEQVDEDLMNLVPDDTFFYQNYERHVLDEKHVAFRVKPAHRPVSTRDFHSKVSLNKGLIDPNHAQMRRLVKMTDPNNKQLSGGEKNTYLTFDPRKLRKGKKVRFHESMGCQAKVVHPKKLEKAPGQDIASKLLDYWWKELKLPNYIAAFVKQWNGGSFFIGLKEEKYDNGPRWKPMESMKGVGDVFQTEREFWEDDRNDEERQVFHLAKEDDVPKYEIRTGFFICEGVRLSQKDRDDLEKYMKKKVHTQMAWYPPLPSDLELIQLRFYDVAENEDPTAEAGDDDDDDYDDDFGRPAGASAGASSSQQSQPRVVRDLCVVEARARNFRGLCFQDKCGPEAYKFDHRDNPTRGVTMTLAEWVEAQ